MTVYAGTKGGAAGMDPSTPVPIAVDPARPGTVYAGTSGGGVFRTP